MPVPSGHSFRISQSKPPSTRKRKKVLAKRPKVVHLSKRTKVAPPVTKKIRHGNYKGGVRTKEWRLTCKRIKRRDNYRCQKCHRTEKELHAMFIELQVNHITPLARGGTDKDSNLQCECAECHSKNPHHERMRRGQQNAKRRKRKSREVRLSTREAPKIFHVTE